MNHPVTTLCDTLGIPQLRVEHFGTWPSPARRLEGLGAHLGSEVWLKDDGGASPTYGGNKVRKLELLLADARAAGATTAVVIGPLGSHQILATAIYARAVGLACRAVVVLPAPPAVPSARAIESTLRAAAEGATLVGATTDAVESVMMKVLDELGENVYVIPSGGSTPLGNAGVAAAALELKRQVDAGELEAPDDVFVPLGTGGSAAALAVGFGLAGLRTRIVAVRVFADAAVSQPGVERQMKALAMRLRSRELAAAAVPIAVIDDQLGAGYGEPTAEGDRAMALLRELESVSLEPTYTAKTMAALLAACARAPERRVLFWQTYNTVPLAPYDETAARAALPSAIASLFPGSAR